MMAIGANVERIVDRAAAHARPSALAVRDSLLVGLAFSAGIYEAICFLSFGKVFTGFQTGNLVFLGLGLAGTRPPFIILAARDRSVGASSANGTSGPSAWLPSA